MKYQYVDPSVTEDLNSRSYSSSQTSFCTYLIISEFLADLYPNWLVVFHNLFIIICQLLIPQIVNVEGVPQIIVSYEHGWNPWKVPPGGEVEHTSPSS